MLFALMEVLMKPIVEVRRKEQASEEMLVALGLHQALRNKLAAEKRHLREVVKNAKPPERFYRLGAIMGT